MTLEEQIETNLRNLRTEKLMLAQGIGESNKSLDYLDGEIDTLKRVLTWKVLKEEEKHEKQHSERKTA